jgi:hypothetical protein
MTFVCPLCADDMTPCYITVTEKGHLAECHGKEKDWIGTSSNRSPLQSLVCAGCGYVSLFATSPETFRHEANRNRGTLPIPIAERALPPIDSKLPLSAGPEEPPTGEDSALEGDQSDAPARR